MQTHGSFCDILKVVSFERRKHDFNADDKRKYK
jgi:hypothetical protein